MRVFCSETLTRQALGTRLNRSADHNTQQPTEKWLSGFGLGGVSLWKRRRKSRAFSRRMDTTQHSPVFAHSRLFLNVRESGVRDELGRLAARSARSSVLFSSRQRFHADHLTTRSHSNIDYRRTKKFGESQCWFAHAPSYPSACEQALHL